jgi:hypothetical protein
MFNRSLLVSPPGSLRTSTHSRKTINNNGPVQKPDSTETRANHVVLETGGTPLARVRQASASGQQRPRRSRFFGDRFIAGSDICAALLLPMPERPKQKRDVRRVHACVVCAWVIAVVSPATVRRLDTTAPRG